jgi:hypothetical protein
MPSRTQASATPTYVFTSRDARAKRRPRLMSANKLCAPAPSHSEAKTLRISQRVRGTGNAVFGRNARSAVLIFARRLSESQGRMRTNRSTTLFDTSPARPSCVIATSAAALTAGSGDSAKPKAHLDRSLRPLGARTDLPVPTESVAPRAATGFAWDADPGRFARPIPYGGAALAD